MFPIWANWKRFRGLLRTVAPTSRRNVYLFSVGSATPKAGLSIPEIRPTTRTPPATMAPVLPAEMQPLASPLLTISIASLRLEFLFFLIAIVGCSSMPICSSAWIMEMRFLILEETSSSKGAIIDSFPTRTSSRSGFSLQAAAAPLQISTGPWSPPMASRASIKKFHLSHTKQGCFWKRPPL